MVKYYYDKYNAVQSYMDNAPWRVGSTVNADWNNMFKSYVHQGVDNIYVGSGGTWTTGESVIAGQFAYEISFDKKTLYRFTAQGNHTVSSTATSLGQDKKAAENTSVYVRGTLIQSNIPAEDGTYPANGRHTDGYWYVKKGVANIAPTVTLTSPSNNLTLYENDILSIVGEAYDDDKDQSVTVYYQINSEQRKVLATNLSQTQISLTKQLTFKGGKLFDGDTAITGTLAEGVAHTLKVWAVDSENASSTVVERAFYVVPNRAPLLTVNPPNPSGIIDVDSFIINGTFEDTDKNETTVSYRINGANPVQVASGVSGTFDFTVTLGALIVGENVITVEAIDSYGAKTSQTVKLRKNLIAVPMTKSVARYKIVPPSGTASEILVWVQRDAELTLKASASMTLAGEQESFAPMTLTVTENLQNGQVEDEFYLAAGEAKDTIVLQLELEKANPTANNAITLIMGVL